MPDKAKSEIDKKIEEFDARNKFAKVVILGIAEAHQEQIEFEKSILSSVRNKDRHFVVGVFGPVAVLECHTKDYEKHPYTAAYLYASIENPEWQHTHSYWNNIEMAILDGIGHRHEGVNTRFAAYAGKMVGLDF